MKLFKLFVFGLAGTLMLVGCEKKETVPTLKTGTFSYTDADNNTYSIELTDETITFHDDTLKCFDTEEEAYEFEAKIVDADFIGREDTYNVLLGGKSGNAG